MKEALYPLKRTLRPDPPRIFQIETLLGCNLKCPACYIGSDLIDRPKAIMPFERFEEIVEKIRPYAQYVYPYMWGEPLLHKRIFDMIALVKPFAKVNISSHAQNLDADKAERIVAAGVDDFIVSLDGLEQDTYEVYRKGGRVEKVLAAIDHLIAAKERHRSPITILVQFIVMKHNEHEIPRLKAMFKHRPVHLALKGMYVQSYEQAVEFMPRRKEYHRYTMGGGHIELIANRARCGAAFGTFTVLVNGDVVQCCFDSSGEVIIGNIFESTVEEIWYGERALALRETFLTGRLNSVCTSLKCGMGREGEMVEATLLNRAVAQAGRAMLPAINRSPGTKELLRRVYTAVWGNA